jgi:GNAT superfamily N-acetyltransferase
MAARVEVTVEPLPRRRRELNEASVVAARAFQTDPFFEFLSPQPLLRARGLALFWRSTLVSIGPQATLSGARDPAGRLVGVAAWVAPGGYPPPVRAQLRQSLGALRAMAPRLPALVDGTKYLLAIDKAHPREELLYLELLVVDPMVQRLGVGALLQRPLLEEADRSGLDCYLETQNEANLAYYRRFGYEVAQVLRPVRGGPPLWTMRRAPSLVPDGGAARD